MLAPPQTSTPLAPTHSLWYESMQDMSGYVLSDTTLPPSDEQLDFSISTAQTENDFYVQNPGPSSPAEFILGDTSEDVIEDSDMFNNFNCDILDSKTEYRAESPIKRNPYLHDNMHSNKSRTTFKMGNEESNLSSHKISFSFHKGKLAATVKNEKLRYLAIFDSEEPFIEEDPDLLYCTQNKMDFDIKADVAVADIFNSEEPSVKEEDMDKIDYSTDFKDMGVAEEVIVITEEDSCLLGSEKDSPLLGSVSSDPEEYFNIPEEKTKKEAEEVIFQLDTQSSYSFSELATVMGDWLNDDEPLEDDLYQQIEADYDASHPIMSNEIDEDYLFRRSPTVSDLFSNNTINVPPSCDSLNNTSHPLNPDNCYSRTMSNQLLPRPSLKHNPLTLDIDAARAALLVDKGISDTPELLEALKPEDGKFDLIKFITTNGDPNNNVTSPTVESLQKKPEAPRKGKRHLSLVDLKQAQELRRGEPLSRVEQEIQENEPLPSISGTSPSGRPARQSATRFNKMIEDGLLCSVVDSQSVSSDDEDAAPKAKRRRTTSTTSSRRRLNSDSDRSSVSGDAMKYRERRDRNNLSSKRSRQKRKIQHQLKQKELTELEDENTRLRLKADQLESVLTRVKAAWADYLAHMKDNDKDRR